MKIVLSLLLLSLIFYSCQKSAGPNGPSGTDSIPNAKLAGMRSYTNNILGHRDTFLYDNLGRVATHKQVVYDMNPGQVDSFVVNLNYAGANNDPTSYTLIDGWGTNTYSLSYDGQGRLSHDTIIPDHAAKAATFTYINNYIVQSSVNNGTSDTFYFTNKNLVTIVQSDMPYDPASSYTIGFDHDSKLINPFATVCQTFNVRLLLSKIDGWEMYWNDYMSDKITSAIHSGGTQAISNTTDASGKVILSTTSAGGKTDRLEYYYAK